MRKLKTIESIDDLKKVADSRLKSPSFPLNMDISEDNFGQDKKSLRSVSSKSSKDILLN